MKSLCHFSVMLLKLPLPQSSVWGLWCPVLKQQRLTVINSSAMEALRALLALISVSLLTQESPCVPTGWQFQGDPTWVEVVFLSSSREVKRLRPGYLGLWQAWGVLPRISVHLGSSSFQAGSPSLVIPPLSSGLCRSQQSPGLRRAHCLGPNCSNCGSSFQTGRGEASRAPDHALASVGTHQWLSRDL